jgi:hypothetical protein
MLASMDLAAASAGPWLVLGVVLGALLVGFVVLAVVAVRRSPGSLAPPATDDPSHPTPAEGWIEDDLPRFLEQPPGVATDRTSPAASAPDPPLSAPEPALSACRSTPAHAFPVTRSPEPGRLLLVLASAAVLLVGIAAALAVIAREEATTAAGTGPDAERDAPPAWDVPDLTAVPGSPEPGDPGAGRLAAASVPIGEEGALSRLAFEGLVLERQAVGVTVAYPGVSVTAAAVPGGPALAHVRLPLWNCLTDSAPDDPVAADCRRLPTEYAELPTPALTVTEAGDGLRIAGRFPTYVRPAGSPPRWTGRVYPFAVQVTPDGDDATGTLHLGTERAGSIDDPRLSDFRRGR